MEAWFIEAEDTVEWVQAGAKLIDVRSAGEFAAGAIPGAIHVPLALVPTQILDHVGPDDTVICYCLSGALADRAAAWLRENGVEAAYNGGGVYSLLEVWAALET